MRILDFVVYRARYAAAVAATTALALLSGMFHLAGAYDPQTLPELYTSREQVLGTVLLLTIAPPTLLAFLISAQRRSRKYGLTLSERGLSDIPGGKWLQPTRWPIPTSGVLLGLVYALAFNTPLLWLTNFWTEPLVTRSIVVGQAILWVSVGVVLSFRLRTALSFHRLGKSIRLDLLHVDECAPFARNGVDDVLAVVLLIALSGLQSLDAQFRIGNYRAALAVGIPAAAFLFMTPMYSIHRRLVVLRTNRVEALNLDVDRAARESTAQSIPQLELLMQHRDRIRNAPTWPIDWSIYSRLAIYFVIPPLAWLGAAFVEFWLDRILDGS